MNTATTTQPNEKALVETINNEAVNQNIKPVADFFRMEGDDTAAVYSNRLLEALAIVQEQYFDDGKSPEEIENMVFEFKQLNTLIISLKNPIQWVSK